MKMTKSAVVPGWLLLGAGIALQAGGCSSCSAHTTDENSGGAPDRVTLDVPPQVASGLAKDPLGRPIVAAPSSGGYLPEGTALQIVYDQSLDDPITAWGDCLERVVSCRQAAGAGPIGACVAAIDACATNAGGRGCCPKTCLDGFAKAVVGGASETTAVQSVFVVGDCVDGFAAMRSAADAVGGGS